MFFIRKKTKLLSNKHLEMEEALVISSLGGSNIETNPRKNIEEANVKRVGLAALIIFLPIFIVLVGLIIVEGELYKSRSESNITKSISFPAVRGIIYDRYGNALLENVPAFRLVVIPSELPRGISERHDLIEKISEITSHDTNEIIDLINEGVNKYQHEILITRNLTVEQTIHLKVDNLKGIRLVEEVKRDYLYGMELAHIIGYTGSVNEDDLSRRDILDISDVVGRNGIEAYYDEILRGTNGNKFLIKDLDTRLYEEGGSIEAVSGSSLYTTLDIDFHNYFFNRLKDGIRSLGRTKGAGIAINPQNGEILSLISIPSYDSNWFVDSKVYVDEINSVLVDEDLPLFNRPISGRYNPASTIKPLIALKALEDNVVSANKKFDDPGYLLVPNPYNPSVPSVFLDWKEHGPVDMKKAIAVSANVYFYIVGGGTEDQGGIGISNMSKYFDYLKLDNITGIDLIGEQAGTIPNWNSDARNEIWRVGDTYNVSIGQGELITTPIWLISYISAIANGGTYYRPYIVKSVKNNNNEIIDQYGAEIIVASIASKDNIQITKDGMEDVIRKPYGTGHSMSDLPFTLAGKSGTAQVGGNQKINALFVAYAPARDPEVAILILIEDAIEGSLNAVPIAKDVLMWYYKNRGFN